MEENHDQPFFPTGAGKTIILIKYIDDYLKNTDGHTAFVWLCPGKGNLEEQSKGSMDELTPQRDTRNLMYSMLAGFEPGSVTFINWELVTKKGNLISPVFRIQIYMVKTRKYGKMGIIRHILKRKRTWKIL